MSSSPGLKDPYGSYYTPRKLTNLLVSRLELPTSDELRGRPLVAVEPGFGGGDFLHPLLGRADVVHAYEIDEDALGWEEDFEQHPGELQAYFESFLEADKPAEVVDIVVQNPPFHLAEEFVDKALEWSDHVHVLQRAGFAEGFNRHEWWESLPLRKVTLLIPRLNFRRKVYVKDKETGEWFWSGAWTSKGGDSAAYQMYEFDKTKAKWDTQFRRLKWRGPK